MVDHHILQKFRKKNNVDENNLVLRLNSLILGYVMAVIRLTK